MIILRLMGGLGNQLFSYAAARRISIVNNIELIIDDTTGFINDHKYQRRPQLDNFNIPCRKASYIERLEPFSKIRRKILLSYNNYKPFNKRSYIKQKGPDFDSRLLRLKPKRNLYLEGYWQSESYFKDIEDIIRSELVITPPIDDANREMLSRIKHSLAVAIHIRFFDVPESNNHNNTPLEYYKNAVEMMESKLSGAHYYIFSDRPIDADSLISLPSDRKTIMIHNNKDSSAYADLWLMTNCKHFIIANSTFSWWAAWLAKNKGKIVIAPGFEKRSGESSWGFHGLLPDDWVKC